MLKKYFLITVLFFVPNLSFADINSELKQIDQRIAEINDQIRAEDIKQQHEEYNEQKYMIADWEKLGQEAKKLKASMENERLLKQELKELEKKRAELLKNGG